MFSLLWKIKPNCFKFLTHTHTPRLSNGFFSEGSTLKTQALGIQRFLRKHSLLPDEIATKESEACDFSENNPTLLNTL